MNTILTNMLVAHSLLWLLVIGLPLLTVPIVLYHRSRTIALWLAPWAAMPALGLSVCTNPGPTIEVSYLLLGMRLGMDAIGQVFLLFTALLWTVAGVYAQAYLIRDVASYRFFAFYLATMTGNLGLILAQDIISFYLFFALMSFAAYGLVVHDGSRDAQQAGRVYLILVVLGEVLLVSALMLAAIATGSPVLRDVTSGVAAASTRDLIIGLVLVGFGIKAGALPLHVWLPLAHPVAPTPASAVLSGAMIKAGLLGWLRFLPLGEVALPSWGSLCMIAGLAAAFYGVVIGLTQDNPKTVLAYSSISQMGFMTVGIGVGLVVPESWPLALPAILIYALHHALAKGALFLGVGIVKGTSGGKHQRVLILIGLLLPALALAGAPLTSGALAKLTLKAPIALVPVPWPDRLGWLLSLAAVGTTLLMGRFLFLMWPFSKVESPYLMPGLWLPWVALLIGVLSITWLFAQDAVTDVAGRTISYGALWPVTLGALLAWGTWRWGQKSVMKTSMQIPAGDLLMLVNWLAERSQQRWGALITTALTKWLIYLVPQWPRRQADLEIRTTLVQMEGRLGRWTSAGMLFLLLAATLFALLAMT